MRRNEKPTPGRTGTPLERHLTRRAAWRWIAGAIGVVVLVGAGLVAVLDVASRFDRLEARVQSAELRAGAAELAAADAIAAAAIVLAIQLRLQRPPTPAPASTEGI
jgi:hypothetical protein